MAGAALLLVVGLWLVVQATAGQLPARLLSWRSSGTLAIATAPTTTGTGLGTAVGSDIASGGGGSGGGFSTGAGSLSAAQVARLALDVGLSEEAAAIAVAIAYRESRFNPRAWNQKQPDNSVGLWQINRLAFPGRWPNAETLMDPAYNARVMAELSRQGTNWRPWRTSSAVPPAGLDYLPQARQAVAAARGAR